MESKCYAWPGLVDCVHMSCKYLRGEASLEEYLDERCNWHFDTNWGRFLPEDKRKQYHDLLVRDAVRRGVKDKQTGLPDIDILAAVRLGLEKFRR